MSIVNLWNELLVGDQLKILKIGRAPVAYRIKLLALGLLPGTHFWVTSVAPLGDPLEIKVRGYCLSLRRKEAELLVIERVS